jgi:hypothetical protein
LPALAAVAVTEQRMGVQPHRGRPQLRRAQRLQPPGRQRAPVLRP